MMDALFNPQSIAVVGASSNPGKAGYVALRNMKEKGYPGKLFPINPNEKQILGYPCYPSLEAIDENIDLVVLIMPSRLIYGIMDEIDRRMETRGDVKVIVCAAADFAETKTQEGIDRQERLMSSARRFGIRVLGPNCIGVVDNRSRVDTTFVETGVPFENFGECGGITFISQSGAIAAAILMEGASKTVPVQYNKFVSIGNMADVDFVSLLEYLEQDDSTRVIGIYMEGCRDGKAFIGALKRVTRKKPVVILKVGRSSLGATAANSHTGSLAGADSVYEAAFKQCGAVRVDTIDELIDTMQAFDRLPLPGGGNVFLLTQAGGPGIYCTDAISGCPGLKMPLIQDETKAKLAKCLLPMANVCHPEGYADITASATVEHHVEGLRLVLSDDNVDMAIFITVIPTFLPKIELAESLVKMYTGLNKEYRKPVFYCIMAGAYSAPARRILEQNGFCTFDTPEKAVLAAKNMRAYAAYKARLGEAD